MAALIMMARLIKRHNHVVNFLKVGMIFFVLISITTFYIHHFGEGKKVVVSWQGFSKQLIAEKMTAENNHQWNAGFFVEASKQALVVSVNIKIIAVDDINKSRLEAQKKYWLEGIESNWRNRFSLRFADGSTIPIVIRPVFTVLDAHHEVVVRDGDGRPNQLNWYLNNSANLIAHEVGHMLGAFDEYNGGAISSATNQLDADSLMGKNTENGQLLPRNLSFVLDNVKLISQLRSLEIVPATNQLKPQSSLNAVLNNE
jgi:hypothetical protein